MENNREPEPLRLHYITNFTKAKESWYKPFCEEVEKRAVHTNYKDLPSVVHNVSFTYRVIGRNVYYERRRVKTETIFSFVKRMYNTLMYHYYTSYETREYTQEQLKDDKVNIWKYNHLRCNVWLDEDDCVKYVDGWY
jgi:hypothetical protein